MNTDGQNDVSDNFEARIIQSLEDEGVSTFVAACIKAAYQSYPGAIDALDIPANRPHRKMGLHMLKVLSSIGEFGGPGAHFALSADGYRLIDESAKQSTTVEAVLKGKLGTHPSEFVLELLRAQASKTSRPPFGGL